MAPGDLELTGDHRPQPFSLLSRSVPSIRAEEQRLSPAVADGKFVTERKSTLSWKRETAGEKAAFYQIKMKAILQQIGQGRKYLRLRYSL